MKSESKVIDDRYFLQWRGRKARAMQGECKRYSELERVRRANAKHFLKHPDEARRYFPFLTASDWANILIPQNQPDSSQVRIGLNRSGVSTRPSHPCWDDPINEEPE